MDTPNEPVKPFIPLMVATKEEKELLELLMSAGAIALREGKDTNWRAFYASIVEALKPFNRRPVTARTYRLPSDVV